MQTDNARCYETPELILGIYIVSHSLGLKLLTYLHTGVQDGKGSIDGHFAIAIKHIVRHCNSGNNVVTPLQIVKALRSKGGVNNSVAEMVSINRKEVSKLCDEYKHFLKRLANTRGHMKIVCNHVNNSVLCYSYSGVGGGDKLSMSNAPFSNDFSCTSCNTTLSHQDDIPHVDQDDVDTDDNFIEYYDDELDDSGQVHSGCSMLTGCAIYGRRLEC